MKRFSMSPLLLQFVLLFLLSLPPRAHGAPPVLVTNLSTPTACAEQDNVTVPLSGRVKSFVVGSSIVVGVSPTGPRPVAEIQSLSYDPITHIVSVVYRSGRKATIQLVTVDRTITRVGVTFGTRAPANQPFATLKSMIVTDGNADVDHVSWTDDRGVRHDDEPILTFPRSLPDFSSAAGTDFSFHRNTSSQHNTMSPDIRIRVQK